MTNYMYLLSINRQLSGFKGYYLGYNTWNHTIVTLYYILKFYREKHALMDLHRCNVEVYDEWSKSMAPCLYQTVLRARWRATHDLEETLTGVGGSQLRCY